jgi:serine/threonine-protein kinase
VENSPRPADATQGFAALNTCAHCGAPFTPVVAGQTVCDKCQGLAHPEPASPLQQAEVAGYKLLRELGAGRFSHSWLAQGEGGEAVVLKLLRSYAPDANSVQRFLAEAQKVCAAPELDHPNLARPVTAGVHLVSAFFLVYQSGGEQTLADELRQRGRILPGRALEFCAQVAEGLSAAHRAGLLHLDLKPANVGLTKSADGAEQAVVLDVVTAQLLARTGLRAGGPLPLSSAAYFSPEEAAGRPPDARSDLYSVGVLLFQLIAGRLPMMGATSEDLLRAHREHPPLRLRDVGRRVHADLEALLARLLAKDAAQRPASGDELAALMRAIIPIADVAPMEDGPEGVEDPVPVVELPRPEPEITPAPPQMLPQVDPGLLRAMMGELPAQSAARLLPPGTPPWAQRMGTRWWPAAAAGALTLLVLGVALVRGSRNKPAAGPSVALSSPVPVPAPPAQTPARSAVTSALQREPTLGDPALLGRPEMPAAAQEPAPARPAAAAQESAARKPAQPAPSPWSKNFERAQKALWTGQPAEAESILQDVLRTSGLPRRDRARASKLMGDAQAKKGNRAAAAEWYRKSLKLFDDPEDREKVIKLLQH